jgi:hypothetical protein
MRAAVEVEMADDAILARPAQNLPRRCGACMACCTALAVAALEKPSGVRCPHACGGCRVYPTRPEECRTFACAWLQGLGRDEDRPDLAGVLVDLVWQSPRQVTLRVIAGGGAVADRLLAEAIARLAVGGVTATVRFSPPSP